MTPQVPRASSAPPPAPDVPLAAVPTTAASAHELSTPESAAQAWLARWCPFDYRAPFGESEQRAQTAMVPDAWTAWNAEINDRSRRSWDATVAARESARCTSPTAVISPEAPRTPHAVIVIVAATRVVSSTGATAYAETVTATRVVLRGADNLWRIGEATEGG
ncbi:hypothetical protein [Kibdelosporangium phytohabitans]|uniref:SnoaL-like domain-containing protein n=1 Tax=Kibdelosporangium phytohabitans TaxID=860235 RepID=A0A0N9HJY1_9PSEU|nr:hypothetical protein [Kibdelosporangium phytohabitans]ALG06371.1 hypothetical protein AOZ06_05030 [Kibdelosporangium phytohabitans]MBE1467514.1 hypothetical protein [Kibdelosporangium phytohabitans]